MNLLPYLPCSYNVCWVASKDIRIGRALAPSVCQLGYHPPGPPPANVYISTLVCSDGKIDTLSICVSYTIAKYIYSVLSPELRFRRRIGMAISLAVTIVDVKS